MRRGRTPRLASWSLWSTEPRSTLQTWATLASRKCSAPSSRMGTGMKRSARIRRCRRQRTQLLGAHPMDSTPRTDRPIRRSCAAPDRRQGHRGIPRPCRPRGPRAGPDPGEAHARPRQPRLRHEASPVSRVDHGSRRSGRCPSAEAERCASPSVVGQRTLGLIAATVSSRALTPRKSHMGSGGGASVARGATAGRCALRMSRGHGPHRHQSHREVPWGTILADVSGARWWFGVGSR